MIAFCEPRSHLQEDASLSPSKILGSIKYFPAIRNRIKSHSCRPISSTSRLNDNELEERSFFAERSERILPLSGNRYFGRHVSPRFFWLKEIFVSAFGALLFFLTSTNRTKQKEKVS